MWERTGRQDKPEYPGERGAPHLGGREQLGIKPLDEAQKVADDLGLDLVEVDPNGSPPVCRIMDYSKYRYEQAMRMKEARKRQTLVTFKEMKFRPKIDPHDYETKTKNIRRFLESGHKVKVTVMFREGR